VNRGDIRVISSRISGRAHLALLLGNDVLTEISGWVITAPVDTTGAAPDLIVTIPIKSPVEGTVRLDNVTSVRGDRVGELVGRLDPDVMERVNIALRAALDL
jgi:mRNA interferase MazF